MIVLLRFRSFMLLSLIVLSLSFIYIGFISFSESADETVGSANPPIELHEPIRVMTEDINNLEKASSLSETENFITIDNFFAEFRMKRDRGRDTQIEILRDIINNPNSSAEIRETAQYKLLEISQNSSNEIKVENILRAKGYEKIVTVVEDDGVTVVAEKTNLDHLDIARISELIIRTIGVNIEDIAIIPKE